MADTSGPEQVEDVSGADRASADAEWGGTPAVQGNSLSVTAVCSAVGCSSLGTFSSRFTDLVGMPPSAYRRRAARATAGMPSCVAKQVTRPIRNREARVTEPQLA